MMIDSAANALSLLRRGLTESPEGPVMVEKDADCPDCGEVHDLEACPRCGADIFIGFGLMFDSFGEYKGCEKCDWFWIRPDFDGMQLEATP